MIIIKNQKEMQKYYDEKTNTYKFNSNVKFNCDIYVKADIIADNINALDIKAWNITAGDIRAYNITALDIKASDDIIAGNINAINITAWNITAGDITANNINALDIKAWDINAWDIIANNISFNAVCFAYKTFVCNAIIGRRENSKYFCLDSDVVIKSEQ